MDWPDSLVTDLARRRAVLVIGSGISRQSVGANGVRPPTWRAFLEQGVHDCPNKADLGPVEEAISANDLLHACECLKKRFDEEWVDYLRGTFSLPAFPPADIHDQILALDSRIVFSLNFDDIYERHAHAVHHGSDIVKNYSDRDVSEFLRGNKRYVIKVHGSLSSPDNLIFTQKDYSRARTAHAAFYQAFDATLLTHTFVFLGSGFSDPDINLLLENQNFGFPSQVPHYFISGKDLGVDRRQSLRENRNLKVLEYDPIDVNHTGLVNELKLLNGLVEAARFAISQNASW